MRTSTSAIFIAIATLVAGSRGIAQQIQQAQQAVAANHLGNARTLLQSVPEKDFSSDKDDNQDAADEVAKLRRQFDELGKAFDASPESTAVSGWKEKFSDVERTLARIIGGGSTLGPTKAGAAIVVQPAPGTKAQAAASGAPGAVEVPAGGVSTPASNPSTAAPTTAPNTVPPTAGTVVTAPQNGGATTTDAATVPAPVGTSGVASGSTTAATAMSGTAGGAAVATDAASVAAAKVSTIGIKRLNPDVRRQLELFRTELELFYVTPVAERPASQR